MYTEKPQMTTVKKKREQFSMQLKLERKLITGSLTFVGKRRNILFKL